MRALFCAALLGVSSAAGIAGWATPTRDAARIQRQSAAEAARAKALKAQADAAARDAAALQSSLANVDAQARATKAAAVEAESQAAGLDSRRLADTAAQARDRRTLELTIAALLQGEAAAREVPIGRDEARAGAIAALAAPMLARTVSVRQTRIDETVRLRAAAGQQRADLEATSAQLALQRQTAADQLASKAQLRLALLAESDRAARRAATLGRQSRSLTDLTDKISARPKTPNAPMLSGSSTGPRMAPVAGRVVIAYGAKTAAGSARGITVATSPGAKIVAPASALVAYAGPFRSYGQVVILDQGKGSALVLTGLQTILAQPGKKVSLGEIIGEMASASASTTPELYFEVREAGRTVDPERWLKARN